MQCEDNSKLRTPLPEVCQTTDIGCVPIVNGRPDCNPQPDELPIAFDPKTTTLWLFSCKTREWVAMGKFNMCQLDALNLDNISNICDVLNIAVNYAGSGECQQGTVTLAELAERILECLKLETKIITIGEGDGNKVKISIDGLPLDPVYVTGRNIWSEGGSGTEADPLKVATYDPICKWPTKTQAQVDAATTKHLGACLDGEMVRIPLSSGSSEYLCVPRVSSKPTSAPLQGTGPLRMGCNNELYVWSCEDNTWYTVKGDDYSENPRFNPSDITNICNNLKFVVWYKNGSDDCMKTRSLSLRQLVDAIEQCPPEQGCEYVYKTQNEQVICCGGIAGARSVGRGVKFKNVRLRDMGNANLAIYQSPLFNFIAGSGEVDQVATPIDISRHDVGENVIHLHNDSNCRMKFEAEVNISLAKSVEFSPSQDYSIVALCSVGDVRAKSYEEVMRIDTLGWFPYDTAYAGYNVTDKAIIGGSFSSDPSSPLTPTWESVSEYLIPGKCLQTTVYELSPGESKDIYLQLFIMLGSYDKSVTTIASTPTFAVQGNVIVRGYRSLYF